MGKNGVHFTGPGRGGGGFCPGLFDGHEKESQIPQRWKLTSEKIPCAKSVLSNYKKIWNPTVRVIPHLLRPRISLLFWDDLDSQRKTL